MFQISLAAARINAGLKQKEVATKIGITEKTLRSYELGHTVIPGYLLQRVAKIYELPSDYIRLPILNDGKFNEDEKNLGATTV